MINPSPFEKLTVIVPAAGIGSRMRSKLPKQYMAVADKTLLEQTLAALLRHRAITQIILPLHPQDQYFKTTAYAHDDRVTPIIGGDERVTSVRAGLQYLINQYQLKPIDQDLPTMLSETPPHWVMVHDAARPCIQTSDIDLLIAAAKQHPQGALLATPVRDTMKQADPNQLVSKTLDRQSMWHALTPQLFPLLTLYHAINIALDEQAQITDEASAVERLDINPFLVHGRADNIKVTQPEDLALATFYLTHRKHDK